jgi:transcriptional regulator with XRE-family HTH domain
MENSLFGQYLARYRNRIRLSQAGLARLAEVDHSYVSRLESGHRSPSRDSIAAFIPHLEVNEQERATLYEAAGYIPEGRITIEASTVEMLVDMEGLLKTLLADVQDVRKSILIPSAGLPSTS